MPEPSDPFDLPVQTQESGHSANPFLEPDAPPAPATPPPPPRLDGPVVSRTPPSERTAIHLPESKPVVLQPTPTSHRRPTRGGFGRLFRRGNREVTPSADTPQISAPSQPKWIDVPGYTGPDRRQSPARAEFDRILSTLEPEARELMLSTLRRRPTQEELDAVQEPELDLVPEQIGEAEYDATEARVSDEGFTPIPTDAERAQLSRILRVHALPGVGAGPTPLKSIPSSELPPFMDLAHEGEQPERFGALDTLEGPPPFPLDGVSLHPLPGEDDTPDFLKGLEEELDHIHQNPAPAIRRDTQPDEGFDPALLPSFLPARQQGNSPHPSSELEPRQDTQLERLPGRGLAHLVTEPLPLPPPVPVNNTAGVLALVLAGCSLLLGFLTGIPAVCFGIVALGQVKRGTATNRGQAWVGSVIGAVLSVIYLAVGVIYLLSHTILISLGK